MSFKSTLNDVIAARVPKSPSQGQPSSPTLPRAPYKEGLVDSFAKHMGLHHWLQESIESVSLLSIPQSVTSFFIKDAKISSTIGEMLAKSITFKEPSEGVKMGASDMHSQLTVVFNRHPLIKSLQETVQQSLRSKR